MKDGSKVNFWRKPKRDAVKTSVKQWQTLQFATNQMIFDIDENKEVAAAKVIVEYLHFVDE